MDLIIIIFTCICALLITYIIKCFNTLNNAKKKSKKNMEPHLLEDCRKWHIPKTDWWIYGFSKSANKTGFAIFSLKIFFDAGLPSKKKPNIVLLTHSHRDHSFNIPTIAMDNTERRVVYCPNEMVNPLKLLCRAFKSLDNCTELIDKEQVNAIGVHPNIIIDYNKIKIKVIKCYHTVPTIGFSIITQKNVLKDEYKNITGKELGKLKKSRVEVTKIVDVIKFIFLGDTTIEVFKDPYILLSPVIFVECTIIDDQVSPEKTQKRGHIHLNQLLPIIIENKQTFFVLIHLSKRYKRNYIDSFFKDILLENENMMVW